MKVTAQQAQEIRESSLSEKVLANKYGIHRSMVGHIRAGRYHKGTKGNNVPSCFCGTCKVCISRASVNRTLKRRAGKATYRQLISLGEELAKAVIGGESSAFHLASLYLSRHGLYINLSSTSQKGAGNKSLQ